MRAFLLILIALGSANLVIAAPVPTKQCEEFYSFLDESRKQANDRFKKAAVVSVAAHVGIIAATPALHNPIIEAVQEQIKPKSEEKNETTKMKDPDKAVFNVEGVDPNAESPDKGERSNEKGEGKSKSLMASLKSFFIGDMNASQQPTKFPKVPPDRKSVV